jgi:uncharacterized protein
MTHKTRVPLAGGGLTARVAAMRLLAAAAFLIGLILTTAPAAAKDKEQPAPTPALWRVSDADSEIYLFAAAPFLPEGEAWRSRAVAAAIDRSETIIFEAPSADRKAQAEAAEIFQSKGRYAAGKTLSDALGEEGAAGLAAVAAALGAETATFDPLKPWAAFVVLSAELDRKRGGDPAAGVEAGVLREAIGRQRPVQFLDSVDGALRVLTDMPEKDQISLLAFLLADWPQQDAAAGEDFARWRAGDAEALAASQAPLKEAAPGAYDRLVAARSQALAERLADLLSSPDEAFVCLPAALVVGEDGVAARLAAGGFSVERMDVAAEKR